METILVSALVSTYNSEKFIKGCLEDLLNQTLYKKGQLEIIVIDSASQENEYKIVEDYKKYYENIVYIKTQEREPLYKAWNRGIRIAKGKYLTNANTDDRHHPSALELLANELEMYPTVALVYPNQIITSIENQTFQNCTPSGYTMYPHFDRQNLLNVTYIGHQPMWRKALHEEFGYFSNDLKIAGDYEWWLRISEKYIFKHIPLLLGLYYYNQLGLERENTDLCRIETSEVRTFYQVRANKPSLENLYPYNYYFTNYFDFSQSHPKNPDFSLIVPLYSIDENSILALNNFLNQTYKNYEVVVVTQVENENYLEEYYKYDKRVRVLSVKSIQNLEDLLLYAIEITQGKIVAFLSTNNRIFPKLLENSISAFSSDTNVKSVSFDFFWVRQASNYKKYFEIDRKKFSLNEGLNFIKSNLTNGTLPPLFLIKKEIITPNTLKMLFSNPSSFLNQFPSKHINQPLIEYYTFEQYPFETKFGEKSNKPRVSVIIPCYNQGKYLKFAVESVVEQVFEDWECIIVNDGSTDNTKEVAKALINKCPDKQIIYLEKQNEGVAIARNYGISHAKGEYILPLDADDFIHPYFLSKTVKILEDNPGIHIVFTDKKIFGDIDFVMNFPDWNPTNELHINTLPNTTLYRKSFWEKAGGYKPGHGYEDWEYWISAIEYGFNAVRIPEVLFFHRMNKFKPSRYFSDKMKDMYNKAKIVSYHPQLYTTSHSIWAEAILKNKFSELPIKNISDFIPHFGTPIKKKDLSSFKVLAIIPVFNEEDIIEQTIQDLISNGIDIYILDDNSNDSSIDIAKEYLGKGVIRIETLDKVAPSKNTSHYEKLLKRIEELSQELDYDWFIYAHADQFLESPWLNYSLKESIYLVDSLGFNTINFKLYNFRPYTNNFNLKADIRLHLDSYELNVELDNPQLNAWKKTKFKVDLASTGGEIVYFQGRNTFPIPFIKRHYPIRSESHGKKKILDERLPRLSNEDKKKHWASHYVDLAKEQKFIWEKEELKKWDPILERYSIITEYALSSLVFNFLGKIDYNRTNIVEKAVEWFKNFNVENESIITEICKTIENSINTLVNSHPQKTAMQLINSTDIQTSLIIQEYLVMKYCHFVMTGNYLFAQRIKEIILYLQNKVLLGSPFINLVGYPEVSSFILRQETKPKDIEKQPNLPTSSSYPKEKISELIERKDFAEALEIISKILEEEPENIDALNDLAIIEALIGNAENAANLLRKVLHIDPNNSTARENLEIINSIKP